MVIARAVKGVFVVGAKRTPFGTYGGKLMNLSAIDLQEIAVKAALEAAKIKPDFVDSTIIGNIFHVTSDGAYISRHVALRVGAPIGSHAMNVNRMCGSGFQSVINGSQEIMLGDSHIVITGGAENMSLSPYAIRGIRFGLKLGQEPVLEDTLWAGLTDGHIKMPMGLTAENLGEKFGITRKQADEYALRSQQRWKKANDAGYFKDEMAPVVIKSKKGDLIVDTDEHPKPDSTIDIISKLPSIFKKDGTVNAANASGISDGAGSIILASEEACKKHNLTPLARIAGYGIAGCDPKIMGIGPVPAIEALLKTTNKTVNDIDLFDINEAFATQFLSVEKSLKLDINKSNVNGGAIALGHPVGASGSRITANLIYELRRRKATFGIGAACIGGGQGIALLIETI